jgi:hypothetical protein
MQTHNDSALVHRLNVSASPKRIPTKLFASLHHIPDLCSVLDPLLQRAFVMSSVLASRSKLPQTV